MSDMRGQFNVNYGFLPGLAAEQRTETQISDNTLLHKKDLQCDSKQYDSRLFLVNKSSRRRQSRW